MSRKRLSPRDNAKLFEEHGGICHLCGGKIQAGQSWQRSHPIPLAAGGPDTRDNWAPAHTKCHAKQTAEIDAPLIAKVRRQYQKHIGATKPKRPWPKRPMSNQWRTT